MVEEKSVGQLPKRIDAGKDTLDSLKIGSSAITGAAAGAMVGSLFMPMVGTGIGAVLGGALQVWLGNRQSRAEHDDAHKLSSVEEKGKRW